VCAAAGFDFALFNDPNNLITYHAASHLYRVCTEKTGCPHFGLMKGRRSGLDGLGFIGLLAKCAPDVGTALRRLVRYLHLHIRGAVTTLEESGKLAIFSYEIQEPDAEATDQIADASLGTMFNIMVALCGPRWKPVEVRFEHSRPSNVAPFRRFFQAPLSFNANDNSLVFAARWLSRPLPAVDPELRGGQTNFQPSAMHGCLACHAFSRCGGMFVPGKFSHAERKADLASLPNPWG